MTPLWLALALPAAELAVAIWFRRRIAYTRYPALMTYLLAEAACHFAAAYHYPIATRYAQPLRMALRAWVVFEVYRFACVRLPRREQWRLVGEAVCISGTCAWLVGIWTRLTPLENFLVFRGYYHIVLAAALWWLVFRLRSVWLAENQDHREYRWGMVRWFSILAISGMFVRGSAGYWVFPFSMRVWWWANVLTYGVLLVNVLALGWRMSSGISCLRPEVAFGSFERAWGKLASRVGSGVGNGNSNPPFLLTKKKKI